MTGPSSTVDQNLLPVQAYFDVYGNFQTFIGQGQPFYATINPSQSGLNITNSTINSTTIGATTPSTGVFTNVLTTTGQVNTTPSGNTDIANKFYVDTVAQGLGPKAACQCGTTANITLSGLQTIDGYTTLAGDRVLVKNQGSSQFNGIYIASATAWTRATDMDVWAEVPGAYTVILNGGQQDTGWVCTATASGTINVTAMPWVQFSAVTTYYAGTGLSLNANTFSITPVGTAGTYGSASQVPVFVTNASGQVTSVTNTSIAISASQITSGTIASSLISGSYTGITGVGTLTAGTWNATPITNSYLANSSITINGNLVSLGGSTTVTANTPNSVTFNDSGAGGASPISFNGSAAQTISYNTIGAPSTTGTNASGTWGINITGNSATVTNGVYTTGSYSNPSWITSILGSIVSGAVASATLATTATNVAGGAAGSLVYQSGAGATTTLALGTTNYVLTAGATAPQYVAQSTLSVGSATSATTATNLAGGAASQIPYQTGSGTTSFIANGTSGQVLTSNGSSAPTWTNPSANVTITDDTSSATAYYPLFSRVTSGTTSTEYTSSTKLNYTPFTGLLAATAFSGSGASLTNLTAGNLTGTIPSAVLGNSTVYIGTTAIALNRASASISLTGTSIDGSAGSATTATTATTATNATNIAITDNTSSVSTYYPVLSLNSSGNNPATTSSTKLNFVPSTGVFSATSFSGAGTGLTGTATSLSIGGAAPAGSLTGTTLASGVVTSSLTTVGTIGTGTWQGSVIAGQYGGTGVANTGKTITLGGNLTTSGAFTTTFTVGANTSLTLPASGTVISTVTNMAANPVTGTPSSTTYLRGDGTWATISAGSGTVTSVSFTGGIISVATATTTPALTVAGTSGGIPYFSSATTWASSGALTANGVVYGGGAGVSPSSTAAGTTGQVLIATTGAAPSWGQVSLTTGVTGILPVANGGTNASSAGITAFNNITGYTASGATGTTSTNLVFSTSPTFTTSIDGGATFGAFASSTALTLGYTGTGASSTTNISTAALTGAFTKTINIGTGGTTGSTTAINIGTSVGSTTTITGGLTLGTALSVANGGTGSTTLTANNVLLGNGTSALQVVAPGTSGNVLTSNGTTWTSAAPSGGGATITGTTSNTTYYVVGTSLTSGSLTTASISNTNVVSYNASTGALSAVSHVSSSDERLKTDWEDLPVDFIENLAKVKHGNFTRIANSNKEVGVSAQSLKPVLPRSVLENDEGMLSVNYGSAALVAAIELAKQVMELKQEIALLKGNK